ncbi:MAG: ABC transporter ATP-binding protein [Clostridiales bacterium]|nr:ABC transporter ATP-binding protein [Clostridiales bacterium]
MTNNVLIKLDKIQKTFVKEPVLKSIDLTVYDGEFITLLGPSGCGKTTTLRIIGGFETPDSGEVFFAGKSINNVPPNQRNINTVFQRYALFPHLNVAENIAFGLKLKKTDQKEIDRRVDEMLKLVNLEGYGKRSIDSLSGGQQQRVAIARALVNRPKVLLLDEPLGALDLKLRKEMQIELKKLHEQLNMTFIYVTHDQEEALTMSDTIVVMRDGEILQKGTPIDIYNEPVNAFVADFIGESNIIPGIMNRDFLVTFLGVPFECVDKGFAPDEPVDVVLRPEDIRLVEDPALPLQGTVVSSVFKGVHYEMMVESKDFTFMVHSTLTEPIGKQVGITVIPDDIHVMKKSDIPLHVDELLAGAAEEGEDL